MEEFIPFLELETSHRELEDELMKAFRHALRSARFVDGPEVEAFEREFAAYCGTKHCVGVSSGTDALRFALIACGVGHGDAVITVTHTFIATVEAISQAGAGVEFVDIDGRTYTMSPESLAGYLNGCKTDVTTGHPVGRRTGKPIKAVVVVHLYGQTADMDPIARLAERYGLMIIEDACQAHGAQYLSAQAAPCETYLSTLSEGSQNNGGWRRAGALGKAAAFSFYPAKNLGACGEAGAVTTNDDQVARKIQMLRSHGQAEKHNHQIEGYNARLDAIQAAFLRVKLRRLDGWNEQRRAAAVRYSDLLRQSSINVVAPTEGNKNMSAFHLYVLRVRERDRLVDHLRASGIETGLHYPVPVHLQSCYLKWGIREGSLPVSERAAREVISIPLYPSLEPRQQQRVIDAVGTFVGLSAKR